MKIRAFERLTDLGLQSLISMHSPMVIFVNPYFLPTETNVYLCLKETYNGIELVVVNNDGKLRENGILLTVNDDGTVSLHPGLGETLGFQRDRNGRIKIRD